MAKGFRLRGSCLRGPPKFPGINGVPLKLFRPCSRVNSV